MTDHKATPEDWKLQSKWASDCEDARCLLELRARVEALEAKYETQRLATLEWGADVDKVKRWSDQHLQRIEALEGNQNSSLVKRVHSCIVGEPDCGHMQARAAIREVAAWMRENECGYNAVSWLEQEADQ